MLLAGMDERLLNLTDDENMHDSNMGRTATDDQYTAFERHNNAIPDNPNITGIEASFSNGNKRTYTLASFKESLSLETKELPAKDKVDRRALVRALESCHIGTDVLLKILVDNQPQFFTREEFRNTVQKALEGQVRFGMAKARKRVKLKLLIKRFFKFFSTSVQMLTQSDEILLEANTSKSLEESSLCLFGLMLTVCIIFRNGRAIFFSLDSIMRHHTKTNIRHIACLAEQHVLNQTVRHPCGASE